MKKSCGITNMGLSAWCASHAQMRCVPVVVLDVQDGSRILKTGIVPVTTSQVVCSMPVCTSRRAYASSHIATPTLLCYLHSDPLCCVHSSVKPISSADYSTRCSNIKARKAAARYCCPRCGLCIRTRLLCACCLTICCPAAVPTAPLRPATIPRAPST